MDFELIKYDSNIIKSFKYNGVESGIVDSDIIDIIEYYASLGESYIGIVDNKVIGVGGVYPFWGGYGSCWLFLNKEAKEYKVSIFKTILNKIKELIDMYNINILTAQCMDDSLEANRLLSHLGFQKNKEIKMALYGRKR